ncbi:SusD-like starch-binding protein associating with outer membrane [Arcticibacter pallidicorallinus]|uniref:SusD-like starch-binding protein associating with outer membrane n=1 Tax=Arcticibacter pallidicorallinus TaxID=1259464 RepID=A0A2T0UBJ7_9SPHI|nr:RagB/SusD family nutrient uptake outer membrane protein [Arcticibacter pallidicorallinus]PRY55264.1 SusD-like starch-binding protein associating with outer membrane [Arcticibacter pallidicorallinus]
MKIRYTILTVVMLALTSSCELDQVNPNAAAGEQVIGTREGIVALSIGLRQYYSTTGLSSVILASSTTAREMKGFATFTTVLELEAGGADLPTANAGILNYWSAMQRVMTMCEDVIDNAPQITSIEPALLSGIMGQAYLFKAMALAELAMAFPQANISTDVSAPVQFVARPQVFAEAIRLLDLGVSAVTATPPDASFTSAIAGPDFDLVNTLYAMEARINLMAGNYQKALDNANLVDLAKTSRFAYTTQSPNPLYTLFNVTKSYVPRDNFGLPANLYYAGDQRYNFYFNGIKTVVGGEVTVGLTGFAASQTTPIPVYLTDEIKLIKAEAILRLNGSLSDALAQINAVRTQISGDPFGVNAGLPPYAGEVTSDALLLEVYKQRCAELYLSGLKWEDTRRFNRPAPPADLSERNRIFYPYPDQERLNNPNTPEDPAI